MDDDRFPGGAPPPTHPPQATPPPHSPPPTPTYQPPTFQQQPPAAPVAAMGGEPRGRSKLFRVLVGLAILSIASVVLVVGAVVVAISVGLFESDRVEGNASSPEQPAPTTGSDSEGADGGSGEPSTPVPSTPDGVTIEWDPNPSSCDGNDKRSFSAILGNTTPGALEVRMRILDSANNFVHQSHVYTVPASDDGRVDLGGIPAGQSIVQLVDESNDEAIGQTNITFESC